MADNVKIIMTRGQAVALLNYINGPATDDLEPQIIAFLDDIAKTISVALKGKRL